MVIESAAMPGVVCSSQNSWMNFATVDTSAPVMLGAQSYGCGSTAHVCCSAPFTSRPSLHVSATRSYCCCCRFALAHEHAGKLADQTTFLRSRWPELSTMLALALAGKDDELSDKADALLADRHLLLTRLLPQYRAVPKLKGKGLWLHVYCAERL